MFVPQRTSMVSVGLIHQVLTYDVLLQCYHSTTETSNVKMHVQFETN